MSLLDVLGASPYNLAYLGGLALGFALAASQAQRRGWPLLPWLTLLAACVAGGIVGSKLLHFDGHVAQSGEKTILGGITGGMLALLILQRWMRSSAQASAVLAPSVLVGFAIGRIGCFLAGCCFGAPTTGPWAVRYAPGTRPFEAQLSAGLLDPGAVSSLPVHATQLYEAVLAAVLALVLWRCGERLRSAGAPALALAVGYGAIRFMVDFHRASGSDQLHFGLETVQWTVAVVTLTAAASLLWRERAARSATPGPASPPKPADMTGRSFVLLAALLVVGLRGSGWLTQLEQWALIASALPALVVLIRTPLLGTPWRAAPGVAAGLLAVMPISQDTLRYPHGYFTVGASATTGDYQTSRDVSPGDDCGPSEPRYNEYDVYGISGAYTRMRSRTDGQSARLQAFFGTNRARIGDTDSSETSPIRGVAVSGMVGGRWIGLSGGLVAGNTIGGDGLRSTTAHPILGLRVGPLDAVHGEIRFQDHEPGPYPDTRLTASLGYGFRSWGESVIRVGVWKDELFVGGRLVTRSGLEIEPFLGLGNSDGSQYGLALRQRFGPTRRAAGR